MGKEDWIVLVISPMQTLPEVVKLLKALAYVADALGVYLYDAHRSYRQRPLLSQLLA